ncbi:MAG: hypothetical protein ABI083_06470 [Lapillicoccus sp.]
MVTSLGAVPIPTPNTTIPVPVASAHRLQLVSMGNPVRVVLGQGVEATVTASGPTQAVTTPQLMTQGSRARTPGTITVAVVAGAQDLLFRTADLVCRDDTGTVVPLTAVGSGTLTVRGGTSAQAVVSGVFRSGAAQLTWQPGGQPVVLWDFTIELD